MPGKHAVDASSEKPERALVHSCSGWPSVAQLATDVARRLERLGVAEASSGRDLDSVVKEALAGRPTFAIDGCPSACCTRLLEAKGVHPARSVGLHELGVRKGMQLGEDERDAVVAGVLARLGTTGGPGGAARRTRVPPPSAAPRTRQAHSTEDYLLAIHALGSAVVDCGAVVPGAPAFAAHVSRMLGVSRASAGEMLERLEAIGLVERGARREVLLTEDGRVSAARAVRRHRLLECFAAEFLGYEPADVYEHASRLRYALDDDVIERIEVRLGGPERCPHGWPVDPALERDESPDLVVLTALAPGDRGVVARLVEHDATLLRWLYRHGLHPGASVELRRNEPATESLVVHVGAADRRIARRAAAEVFVRITGGALAR